MRQQAAGTVCVLSAPWLIRVEVPVKLDKRKYIKFMVESLFKLLTELLECKLCSRDPDHVCQQR